MYKTETLNNIFDLKDEIYDSRGVITGTFVLYACYATIDADKNIIPLDINKNIEYGLFGGSQRLIDSYFSSHEYARNDFILNYEIAKDIENAALVTGYYDIFEDKNVVHSVMGDLKSHSADEVSAFADKSLAELFAISYYHKELFEENVKAQYVDGFNIFSTREYFKNVNLKLLFEEIKEEAAKIDRDKIEHINANTLFQNLYAKYNKDNNKENLFKNTFEFVNILRVYGIAQMYVVSLDESEKLKIVEYCDFYMKEGDDASKYRIALGFHDRFLKAYGF